MATTETAPAAASKHRIANSGTQRQAFLLMGKGKAPSKLIEIGSKDDIGIIGAQPNPVEVDGETLAALKKVRAFGSLVDKGVLQVR